MRRLKKQYFLGIFGATVAVLGIIRVINQPLTTRQPLSPPRAMRADTSVIPHDTVVTNPLAHSKAVRGNRDFSFGLGRVHKLIDVYSFEKEFDDVQDVQIVSARKWGVKPVRNREQAEKRKEELVYIGSNPYYRIDPRMKSSIPYLIPRAATLLQTIARNYLDSLRVRNIPLHKILVSSVLRTEEDVAKLRQTNQNATDQSCHRFGTTFDIPYNRYETVEPPGEHRRHVTNDTLKWVLAQTMRDVHKQGLCYIKYERKQGCFHITVR